MPTPTIAHNTHTPNLDSDSEMSLYHYLAAAALDIPTPTDHHAYLIPNPIIKALPNDEQ